MEKSILILSSLFILAFSTQLFAQQTVRYVSCPGSSITLTMDAVTGTTFYWYHQKTGGSVLSGSPSNNYTLTTNTLPDTFWVEPRMSGTILPRIPIIIYKSSVCGSLVPQGCLDGSLLYSQDFGGNNPSDAGNSPNGLPEISSDLAYHQTGQQGHYTLTKNPGFLWNGYYHTDDHTYFPDTTRGYMMYVDPAQNQLNAVLFSTTIRNLCDGMKLSFSSWFINVNNYTQGKPLAPKIKMQILNKLDNSLIVNMGTVEIAKGNSWKQYGFDFLLPAGVDSVIFRIINMENSTTGNDLGIDDIEIRFCAPPVTIDLPDAIEKCAGENLVLDGSYIDNGTFGNNMSYRWEYSTTGNIFNPLEWSVVQGSASSTDMSNTVLSSLVINSLALSDTGYYRLVVGTETSIDLWSCRAVSKAVHLKIKPRPDAGIIAANAICAGTTTQLSSSGNWISTDPDVATVTNTGLVTGINAGSARFVFISSNGCTDTTAVIWVDTFPKMENITANNNILCTNSTIELSCTIKDGVWRLSDDNAQIYGTPNDNPVLIKGNIAGETYIYYTVGNTCKSTTSLLIKIISTVNPHLRIGIQR